MANSFILKILLLFLVTLTTKTNVAANDLISEICPKTKNPVVCNRFLQAKPEAQQATSLHSLGEICMDLGIVHASRVIDVFYGLLEKKGLKEKPKYRRCQIDYTTAYQNIVQAKTLFMQNELEPAIHHAGIAARTPSACGMLFATGREPKVLKRINDEADAVFSIPVTIAREMHKSARGN